MMSHQGRSPDNPPLWEPLQHSIREKKKSSSAANKACFYCRMESYGLLSSTLRRSVGERRCQASFPHRLLFKPPDCCAGVEWSMVSLFVLSPRLGLAQHYTTADLKASSED